MKIFKGNSIDDDVPAGHPSIPRHASSAIAALAVFALCSFDVYADDGTAASSVAAPAAAASAAAASAAAASGVAAAGTSSTHTTKADRASRSATAAADDTVAIAAVPAPVPDDKPWLHQTLSLINSSLTRFGPYRTGNAYLEYEYFGSNGPFTLYGYVDALKVLNVGTTNTSGVWDKGAPIFSEQEPKVALDTLAGKDFELGPFKHIYLATDWIYEMGGSRSSAQNTVYMGLGTDIDTHTPLSLSANLYVNRQFQNYGSANEYSWDGYRFQMNYFYFLGHAMGGDWSYAGFFNYDFGSKLREEAGNGTYADNEFDETNALIYSRGHLRLVGVARYFHNGGQWDSSVLNFGSGNFQNRSTGWGYYLEAGYQWGK